MALLKSNEKLLSALLRNKISKHHQEFNCLNCLHSFRTEENSNSQERFCKKKLQYLMKKKIC